MRLFSARLIVSLIIGVTLVSLCSAWYEVLVGKRNMRRDLQRRAEVLGESLAGTVERDLEKGALKTLNHTVQRFERRENLLGIAVYDPQGKMLAAADELAPNMSAAPPVVLQAIQESRETTAFQKLGRSSVYICVLPLRGTDDAGNDVFLGALAIVHDSGFIKAQSLRVWRETFLSALAHMVLIVFITLLIVRWSIEGPIARTAHWIKALRTGRAM